jgi:hypothetical protein
MTIRTRIANGQTVSTSLPIVNQIRLSKPSIAIKPSVTLSELNDVSTVAARNDDALLFSATTKKFVPTDISDIREEITTVNKLVGGFF